MTNVIADPSPTEPARQIEVMGLPLHSFTRESVIRHLIDKSSEGKVAMS